MTPSDPLIIFECFATLGAVAFIAVCVWRNYRSGYRHARNEAGVTGLEELFSWIASLAEEEESEEGAAEHSGELAHQ